MTDNNLHESSNERRTNMGLAITGISLTVMVICFSLFLWVTREKSEVIGECKPGDIKVVGNVTYTCQRNSWDVPLAATTGHASTTGNNSPADTGSSNTTAYVFKGSKADNSNQIASVTSGNMTMANGEKKNDSPACMCDNQALTNAVLDRINETGFEDVTSSYDATASDYKTMQTSLNKLRNYASRLTDTCLQANYLSWVAWYQKKHDEGLDKLLHPGKTSEEAREDQKEAQLRKEAEECKRNGTVPKIRWK